MKQMARGALAIATLVGLTACVDDPQERVNNDDFNLLQAYPEVAWVKSGPDSTPVYFRLLNDFGYGTPTKLTVSDIEGPIVVHQDSAFRRYYTSSDTTAPPIPYVDGHIQRFYVLKPTPGEASFKVTASNGVSTVVRIRIEANDLGALPTQTAVAGQNITLTAPAFQKFAPDAQVTYLRGARPAGYPVDTAVARAGTVTSAGPVVARAADGSTLTFRAAADLVGKLTVTKTFPTHSGIAPDFTPVALISTDTLHVPGFGTKRTVDYTFGIASDTISATGATFKVGAATVTTPNPGDLVTVSLGTLPGNLGTAAGNVPLAFLANTRIFVGGIEAGVVHTGTDASTAMIGADSNSVTIHVPAHIASGAGGTVPVTLQNAALNFDPTYLFGSTAAAITAVQTGNPAVLKIGTLTSTTNTMTVGNFVGTNLRTTAPQLPKIAIFPTTAANVRSFMINDITPFTNTGDCLLQTAAGASIYGTGAVGCKIYKLGLETGRAMDVEMRFPSGTSTRLGAFLIADGAIVSASTIATNPTAAVTTGFHAVLTNTAVAATAPYLVIVSYTAGQPAWISVRVTER